ncbi:HtaA domain-containing protein [Streptomyces sp. NPDC057638]|uniref:HtaA domain-containing protein n=1 Tax=Streptomyces sp. NPDC057638 TaxID=3346190 RepID=UPI00368B2D7A
MLPTRPARAFAVALLVALPGALLPAGAAQAAERTVQGGRLDWGLKSSFQKYVTGPIAGGGYRLSAGAATIGTSGFRFHSARGGYDPGTGAFESRFTGGVHFTGHRKPSGEHELELTLANPTVKVSGGRGTLHLDVVSKARGSGKVTRAAQVGFAALDLSGIDMRGGTSPITLTNVPATLTARGATAFAGFYPAGTPLDPVSLRVDVRQTERRPAAPPKRPAEAPAQKPATPARAAHAFQDAAVDWGVRRTFREYVTGSIAQGRWTLSGGAQDGGALFRFPRGTGTYDPAARTLDASFAGAVRFTGQHLDLTLSAVSAKVTAGRGTLSADVTSAGTTTRAVPLVTFAAPDLTPEDGLASLTEAPATLTAEGARAFGSLYRAGTAMDPVSLAVAVDRAAALPALPDLGDDTPATTPPPPAPATPAAPEPVPAAASADDGELPVVAVAAGGAGALALTAVAFLLVRRRRDRRPTQTG